jgi:CRP/FNR family transcriptional regulator, cyclic AMP receptor protein
MKDTYLPVTDAPPRGKLRSPLAPVALTALRAIQTTKVCPKGFELFLEGRKPCGIYILYSGRVELSIADSTGRPMLLGTALPGDVLGLSAAVSGTCYEETAVATVTSQTGFVKRQDFLHFVARHPEAAFWVVQLLSDRVTATLEQLSCINDMPSKDIRQVRKTQ